MISIQVIESKGIRGGVERILGREQPASLKVVFSGIHDLPGDRVRDLFGWDKDNVAKIRFTDHPNKTIFQTLSMRVAEHVEGKGESSLTFHDLGSINLGTLREALQRHMVESGSDNVQINGLEAVAKRLRRR